MTLRIPRVRAALAALLALALAVILVGCGPGEPDTLAPDPPAVENGDDGTTVMPEADPGLVLVETKCSGCHELARVWAKDTDRAGWDALVARMEANGLQVTAEERQTIIDYLAEN